MKGKNNKKQEKKESFILVSYSLRKLKQSDKTRFGYALKGRGGDEGVINSLRGFTVGRNVLIIPLSSRREMKEFMGYWGVEFREHSEFIINIKGVKKDKS